MTVPSLRILLIEDSTTDATIITHTLQTSGLNPEILRVETESEIRAALQQLPDVVLSDYSLPGFTAIEVLEWFRQSNLDAPFILVSGTIDAETAVATMRAGAFDYLLKSNLAPLGGAVLRAIESFKLQRAKRAAEAKVVFLAQMLDLAADAIIVCDFERSLVQYWNKGAERLYGWTVEQAMGMSVEEIIETRDEDLRSMIKGLLRNGEWNAEVPRKLLDGREIVVNERATLARDTEGRPTAILLIHHDITERKRAEEQIRHQESLLRETRDVAKIGSWEVNVPTGETYWTPEIARVLGLPPDQSASVELGLSFYHGEHLEKLKAALQAAVDRAEPYDLELEITAADGNLKWVRIVGHPVVEKGQVVRLFGIFQDISARRQAEDRLREQARLLDLTSDAILVTDFETGKIIYWNQGAERMHGWTADEALGKRVVDLLLLDEKAARELSREARYRGEWSGELRERTKDGRELIVSSRVTLVRDDAGHPRSMLSIHTDITERKDMEAQFLRAQRLESVGTLASGVAHDLNNILAPIVLAGPLLEGNLCPEMRDSLLETINTSARRGVEIVRQVLMFARGIQGERRPVDCRQLVKEIGSIASETFSKSITIETKAAADLWPALGDSTQLQQILLNLAINARDAMPQGGSLHIAASNFTVDESFASMRAEARTGPHVHLRVSDTGTGIPRAIIDKIFDPFFTTKEVGKGTGLGLSTVLGIVKSHGGFLWVESEVGRGTGFDVYIPATSPDSAPLEVEPAVQIPRGNNELVLLVDDERNIRTVAEAIMTQAGYRVLLAADGTEAIACYAEHRGEVQVVVTDAVMPYLDGAALTRALRSLDPGVKVIGTSGHGDDQRPVELKTIGVQAFLNKPYDRKTLLLTLHEVLHGKGS